MNRLRCLVLLFALLSAACDDMADQDRHRAFERAPELPGAMANQLPVPGTVARGSLERPVRPELTPALIERGRDRYAIFCVPCHGTEGRGDGPVAGRTMPYPPDFRHAARASTPEDIVDVIESGEGPMPPYGDRIRAGDRWAIAAYVQSLREAGQ